jgi:succinate-acetate transporter protein
MAQIAADRESAAAAAPAVANPAPLGLSAFALTTFVLSANNANLYALSGINIVVGLALFYGGLGQLIAGIQEFRAGNTFGAAAFCSYGGFWLAVGVILTPAFGVNLGNIATAVGFGYFFLGFAIFTLLMFLGTLRANIALMTVFGLLTLTFIALAIGWLGAGTTGMLKTWVPIGGWLGIATALAAWYTALAGVLASTKSAFKLPVFPLG